MIRQVSNNRLYGYPVTDDICTATKYPTPRSRVHNVSGRMMEYTIYHYENYS